MLWLRKIRREMREWYGQLPVGFLAGNKTLQTNLQRFEKLLSDLESKGAGSIDDLMAAIYQCFVAAGFTGNPPIIVGGKGPKYRWAYAR